MSGIRSGFSAVSSWLVAGLLASSLVLIPSVPAVANAVVSPDGSNSEIDFSVDFANGAAAANTNVEVIPSDRTFTVEAWIRPDSFVSGDAYKTIFSQNQDGGGTDNDRIFLGLHWNVGTGQFDVHYACDDTIGDFIAVPGGVKASQWSHIALSHSATNYQIILNGVVVASNPVANCQIASAAAGFAIGATGGSSRTHFFLGEIDQVKIWDEPLTATEVGASMHVLGVPAGATKGLRARYDFNETTGTTVNNRASSNYNLTLSGTYTKPDVKTAANSSDGSTVITFPRTYLPGVGGWRIPSALNQQVRVLVVAGGGAGGSSYDSVGAGGGGAGGLVEQNTTLRANETIRVQVGLGGVANNSNGSGVGFASAGFNGQDSSLNRINAIGGGGGGGRSGGGESGGSGGGAGGRNIVSGGEGTELQGAMGGSNQGAGNRPGAGGGGAGAQGSTVPASPTNTGYAGGAGLTSQVLSGTFASGGAGGSVTGTLNSSPAGASNTGAGGVGGDGRQKSGSVFGTLGGDGGSGIIAVRVSGAGSRSLVLNTPSAAPGTSVTLSGTVSAVAGTQILSLEASTGSFTIASLPAGVAANTGTTAVNPISLRGEPAALNAALRLIRFNAPSVASPVTLSGKVVPLIPTTSAILQDVRTGNLYIHDAVPRDFNAALSFANAQTRVGLVGYLANITSAAENAYLIAQSAALPSTFGATSNIGLSDRGPDGNFSTTWSWVTGPAAGQLVSIGHTGSGEAVAKQTFPSIYQNWENNEPNGNTVFASGSRPPNCGVTNYNSGASGFGVWDDSQCSASFPSLIEFGGLPGDVGFTSVAFQVQQPTIDVEFSELNFDYANSVNVAPRANAARCADSDTDCNGKLGGDKVLFRNVSTKNGVSIDAVVTTLTLSAGTRIMKYEVGAGAGGEASFFQVDVQILNANNAASFQFDFFLAGTYQTSPVQVRLRNVNVSAIDIDYFQFNDLSNVDGYTRAEPSFLKTCVGASAISSCTTSTVNPSFAKPNFLRFQGRDGHAVDDPRDMGIATYGTIETFVVRFGSTRGSSTPINLFGVAFMALPWDPSTPVSFGQSFTLSYNVNGGSGAAPNSQTGTLASSLTLANRGAIDRTGFQFVGWNTEADGSGTSYATGARFTMPEGGDILYAQWTPLLFALTYDANGGGAAPASQQLAAGSAVRLSATQPTRTGFTFRHWSQNQNGTGTTFSPVADFTMPGQNTTLFAQWQVVTGTLQYNANLGTTTQSSVSVTAGATVTVATGANTTRTGYVFAGWNTAQNASGNDFVSGSSIVVPQGTTTLFAQWTPILYSINYLANGGSGAPANGSAVADQTIAISGTIPVRSGYLFTGWNTVQAGTGTAYSSSQAVVMSASNLVLFAQWSLRSYSLSYNINGGDSGLPVTQSAAAFSNATVASTPPVRSGFKFNGWNTLANGNGTNYATGSSLVMPAADVVLHAQWVSNIYDIVYNANGGVGAPEPSSASAQPISISASTSSRIGHIFDGWSLFQNGSGTRYVAGDTYPVSGDTFFFARWIVQIFNLFYDVNGGDTAAPASSSASVSQSVTVATETPSRSGFVFSGWATSRSGASSFYLGGNGFQMPANDVTLFAIWAGAPFTLTYNANGGGSAPANETLRTEETTLIGSWVSRQGYVFSGWNTAPDGSGSTFSPNAVFTMPGQNVTMYAQWTLAIRNITFDDNTGSNGPADIASEFQSVVTIPAAIPVRPGFNFTGWNTQCDGQGTPYQPGDVITMPATDLALCAQWVVITYILSYNANGGVNPPASQPLAAQVVISSSALLPQRDGYSFIAWNTAADSSGTRHVAGSNFTMPPQDTTLFATWIANPYAVYFNANGGTGAPSAQPSRTGETLTITPDVPTRPGFRFVNWNNDASGADVRYSSSTTISMPARDITLFAQWEFLRYTLTYNANGGTGAPVAQANLTVSQDVTLAGSTPTRNGFTFVGWNRQMNGSGATFATGSNFVMPAQNVTLWAVWVAQEFEVIYNANGGTGEPSPQAASTSTTVTIPATVPTRSGFVFDHWTSTQNGSGATESPSGTFTMPAGGRTLFAQWSAKSVTISFDINGGSGVAPYDVNASYSDQVPLAASTGFSRSGQTLLGWNTEQNGSGVMYSPEQLILMPAENLVLFAQWSARFYALEYDAAGGTGQPTGTIATAGQSVPVANATPSRTGFNFTQWTSVAGSSTYAPGSFFVMPPSNYILFATWAQIQPGVQSGGGGPVFESPIVVLPTVSPTVSPTLSPTVSPTVSPTASPSLSPTIPGGGVEVETDGEPRPPKRPGNQVIDYMIKEEKYDPNTFENWNSGEGDPEDVVVEADTTSLNDSVVNPNVALESQPQAGVPGWIFWLGGLPLIGGAAWLLARRRRS